MKVRKKQASLDGVFNAEMKLRISVKIREFRYVVRNVNLSI